MEEVKELTKFRRVLFKKSFPKLFIKNFLND